MNGRLLSLVSLTLLSAVNPVLGQTQEYFTGDGRPELLQLQPDYPTPPREHNKAVDLIFISEGFLGDSASMARFEDVVYDCTDYVFGVENDPEYPGVEPFRTCKRYFNVYCLRVSSVDDLSRASPFNLSTRQYDTPFDVRLRDNIVSTGQQTRSLLERAKGAKFPFVQSSKDVVCIVVNVLNSNIQNASFNRQDGMGHSFSVTRSNEQAERSRGETMAHEIGHGLADLDDEYPDLNRLQNEYIDAVSKNLTSQVRVSDVPRWSAYLHFLGVGDSKGRNTPVNEYEPEDSKNPQMRNRKCTRRPTRASCIMACPTGGTRDYCPPCLKAIRTAITNAGAPANVAPASPTLTASGSPTVTLLCSSVDVDEEGSPDRLRFLVDWGDSTVPNAESPYTTSAYTASGVPLGVSHSYGTPGTYAIRVRACDTGAELSAVSTFNVTIP